MAYWYDPTGKPTFGIGICGRCSKKMSLLDLYPDPNSPGLMVCKEDLDQLDPYRLPARQTEQINLPFVRPDLPLTGVGTPYVLPTGQIITEDSLYFVITEDGDFVIVEGASEIQTQNLVNLDTEDDQDLLVEPWI